MPKNPEPIDLIVAKGKKHLTKKEIEERRESEPKVPFTDVKPPTYLTKKQKKKFKDLAGKLLAIGIMTELDVDCLARYIISHDLYLAYTSTLGEVLEAGNFAALKDVQNMQDKAFRQAHTAAKSLGLTIVDRCKVAVPPPPDDDDDEL